MYRTTQYMTIWWWEFKGLIQHGGWLFHKPYPRSTQKTGWFSIKERWLCRIYHRYVPILIKQHLHAGLLRIDNLFVRGVYKNLWSLAPKTITEE